MTVYITETKVYEIDMEEYIEFFNENMNNEDETIDYYDCGWLIQDYIFDKGIDYSDGDENVVSIEADKEEEKLFDKYIKNVERTNKLNKINNQLN